MSQIRGRLISTWDVIVYYLQVLFWTFCFIIISFMWRRRQMLHFYNFSIWPGNLGVQFVLTPSLQRLPSHLPQTCSQGTGPFPFPWTVGDCWVAWFWLLSKLGLGKVSVLTSTFVILSKSWLRCPSSLWCWINSKLGHIRFLSLSCCFSQ